MDYFFILGRTFWGGGAAANVRAYCNGIAAKMVFNRFYVGRGLSTSYTDPEPPNSVVLGLYVHVITICEQAGHQNFHAWNIHHLHSHGYCRQRRTIGILSDYCASSLSTG